MREYAAQEFTENPLRAGKIPNGLLAKSVTAVVFARSPILLG